MEFFGLLFTIRLIFGGRKDIITQEELEKEKERQLNEIRHGVNLSAYNLPFCTSGKSYEPEEIWPEKYKNNPEKLNLEKQENDQENKYIDVNI